jgi:hypothetical protein
MGLEKFAGRCRASRFLTLGRPTLRQIVVAGTVTGIVIFVVVTVNSGLNVVLWLKSWIIAWPTAFCVVRWVVPRVLKKLGLDQ